MMIKCQSQRQCTNLLAMVSFYVLQLLIDLSVKGIQCLNITLIRTSSDTYESLCASKRTGKVIGTDRPYRPYYDDDGAELSQIIRFQIICPTPRKVLFDRFSGFDINIERERKRNLTSWVGGGLGVCQNSHNKEIFFFFGWGVLQTLISLMHL